MFSTTETRWMITKEDCDHQCTDKPWGHANHFKSCSEFSFQILFRIHRNPQADLRNHKNFDKISGQASSSHSQYKIYFLNTCFPISGIGKHVFWDVKAFTFQNMCFQISDIAKHVIWHHILYWEWEEDTCPEISQNSYGIVPYNLDKSTRTTQLVWSH